MSQELTKRIVAGNFRHLSLKNVVTDAEFQAEHLSKNRVLPQQELAQLLMEYSWRRKAEQQSPMTAGAVQSVNEHHDYERTIEQPPQLLSSEGSSLQDTQTKNNIRVLYNHH